MVYILLIFYKCHNFCGPVLNITFLPLSPIFYLASRGREYYVFNCDIRKIETKFSKT